MSNKLEKMATRRLSSAELMNTSSKARQRHKPPRKGRSKTVLKREESEDALDEALQDTYPASDPLAII